VNSAFHASGVGISNTSLHQLGLRRGVLAYVGLQVKLREMDCPSDEDIRGALGNVLYKIRFPTMTPTEFAKLTAYSKVLSGDEKHDVYVYFTNGKKLKSLKFSTERRGMRKCVVSRFREASDGIIWLCDGSSDAISIETTENMHLTGVGLYGGKGPSIHVVKLEVIKGISELLSTTVTTLNSHGSSKPVKIALERPVCIHANSRYTVVVFMQGPSTFFGMDGVAKYDFPNCSSITFYQSVRSANGTTVSRGQIPQLYFLDTGIDRVLGN